MSVIPQHTSTLTIAKESLAMSEKTGDKTFQRMALGLMALTGIGTLLHAVHEIYRDMQPKRENSKPGLPAPAVEQSHERPHAQEPTSDESWVRKGRVSELPAEGDRVWAESVSRQAQPRHR